MENFLKLEMQIQKQPAKQKSREAVDVIHFLTASK
jgi:hypothetical protein